MMALTEIKSITNHCMKADHKYDCFIDNCDAYARAWGIIFDADLKCAQYDMK